MDLLTHGPRNFACENKTNIDNFSRLLDAVNKGKPTDKDKGVLNLSISDSEADALAAMKQMGDISTQATQESHNIANSLAAGTVKRGPLNTIVDLGLTVLTGGVSGVVDNLKTSAMNNLAGALGKIPGGAKAATKLMEMQHPDVLLFAIPEEERIKAKVYIDKIIDHWKQIQQNEVKDWKTYVISEYPGMYSSDNKPEVVFNSDSSITIQDKSKIFLGVYSHFATDSESVPRSSAGYETSVGMITSTSVTIDESQARVTQKKEYQTILERTGISLSHMFNWLKQSQPTIGSEVNKMAKGIEAVGVNNTISAIGDMKGQFPTLPIPTLPNWSLPVIVSPAAMLVHAAEKLTDKAAGKQSNAQSALLEEAARLADMPPGSTRDMLVKAYNDKIAELSDNPYIKEHDYLAIISRDVEQLCKAHVTPSLNPEDKDYALVRQVAVIRTLSELIRNPNALAAKDLTYSKNGLIITVKTIGDIALKSNLIGSGLLYIKFFNNNGTINLMLTGFWLLQGYRHEISSTGSFNTEMTLMGYQLRGMSASQANSSINWGDEKAKTTSMLPPFPPKFGGNIGGSSQATLGTQRSFSPNQSLTYTKEPVTITQIVNVPPPLPVERQVFSTINTANAQVNAANESAIQIQNLSRIDAGSVVGNRPPPMLIQPAPIMIF